MELQTTLKIELDDKKENIIVKEYMGYYTQFKEALKISLKEMAQELGNWIINEDFEDIDAMTDYDDIKDFINSKISKVVRFI